MRGNHSWYFFPRTFTRFRNFFCAPVLLLVAMQAAAADGYYDSSFGNFGRLVFLPALEDLSADSTRLHILADGTLLLGGSCNTGTAESYYSSLCLAWLEPDGSHLNHNYGAGGSGYFAPNVGQQMALMDMGMMPDGRIVLLGSFGPTIDVRVCMVLVVRADGTALDTTVGAGTGHASFTGDGPCSRMAVQGDGKMVLAGSYSVGGSGGIDMAVVRVLADLGGFDPQFNGGQFQTVGFDLGGSNIDSANSIALQPDGRIVIAGSAQTATGFEPAFARFLADGKIDSAVNDPVDPFGPPLPREGRVHFVLGGQNEVNAIALDRAGNIVFGGYLNQYWLVGRVLKNGSAMDPAFASGSPLAFEVVTTTVSQSEAVRDIALQSDGRILATGVVPGGTAGTIWGEARLLPDGLLDPSFGIDGLGTGDFGNGAAYSIATAIAIGDGGIYVAGYGGAGFKDPTEFGVARLQLDLIFANTFE